MFFFDKTPSVSGETLLNKLKGKPVIIDIRQADAFNQGHIPGAKNLSADQAVQQTFKEGQEVFVVCYAGMSSQSVVKKLNKQGVDAYSVTGGMGAWKGPMKGGK
ncbi:rhodanese-like domain-containing protein [Vagococcus xieshaowenii]|uniref:Rhodanese-like domain-containing protein n=1 Tax=Vagococcus xieshaowenii TaxID=2562451 RepID=A0AAJ5EDC3_9ENTE|nr:rhodanese-like domain-containing protein [Vagococcus xieshaowenii]QCA27879.1 rhodanese-like domain-containing protein [Vagococcus xieshaowenii]TFZ39442.1 rhodanese-like domain-containing protein [Vagococcus xieshaowenii]